MITHDQLDGLLGLNGHKCSPRIVCYKDSSGNENYGMVVATGDAMIKGKYENAVVRLFGAPDHYRLASLCNLTVVRLADVFDTTEVPNDFKYRVITKTDIKYAARRLANRATKLNIGNKLPVLFHKDTLSNNGRKEKVEFVWDRHDYQHVKVTEVNSQTSIVINMTGPLLKLLASYIDNVEDLMEKSSQEWNRRLHELRVL